MPCNGKPSTRHSCSTITVAVTPAAASATYAAPCSVTSTVAPAASQRYAETWRASVSRRARSRSAISRATPLATRTTPVMAWVRSEVTDLTTSEKTTTRPRAETKPREGSSGIAKRLTGTSERMAAATTPPPLRARSPETGAGTRTLPSLLLRRVRCALTRTLVATNPRLRCLVHHGRRDRLSGLSVPASGDTAGSVPGSASRVRRTGGRTADRPVPSAYDGSGHRA